MCEVETARLLLRRWREYGALVVWYAIDRADWPTSQAAARP
jgi:hypothetical protein